MAKHPHPGAVLVLVFGLLWMRASAADSGKPNGPTDGRGGLASAGVTGPRLIRPDQPNAVTFPTAPARYVRFVIHAASAGQPCIDELEVYGTGTQANLAAAQCGAKATASSCLPGYTQHAIEHLNDGDYGNANSWIAAQSSGEWAQIELHEVVAVNQIVFSRDRTGQYTDRVPTQFEVQLSLDGQQWTTVAQVNGRTAATGAGGQDLLGQQVPPPPPPPCQPAQRVAEPLAERADPQTAPQEVGQGPHGTATPDRAAEGSPILEYALLGEEHAWLKTYGHADLSSRLVPYNGRVKEYPRHVAADVLPLPPLDAAPQLDGRLDDPCWNDASRGVVRVAELADFHLGPLVEAAVTAGHHDGQLYLALDSNRVLSRHLAVVSNSDGTEAGVLVLAEDGTLHWNTYASDGAMQSSAPVDGAIDPTATQFEVRLPLAWFPNCQPGGLRIGLGMGGKHTANQGRPVHFLFSALAIREAGPCQRGVFRVQLRAAAGAAPVRISGNVPELRQELELAPGQARSITIPGHGPIGPEFSLDVHEASATSYALHLLRYDPLGRTLTLLAEMIERFAARGLDVGHERDQLAELQAQHQALLSTAPPNRTRERQVLYAAHRAKRQLLLRDPELHALGQILFVQRHAYQPSHNYSVLFDAPYRPGGGVCRLDIPRVEGRWVPDEARLTRLFDAAGGIARDPMADFDRSPIYFGYRPAASDYFHIMAMDPDGTNVKQLTRGPFHDYWPCPLPDGGVAFISTRCRSRYLCWRPQAAVLFRMEADGQGIRPLSFANLTEWGPSVMSDGRIVWQRSEYIDKGADFSHTLWAIRPDGTCPELIFGNGIIQPNGYANGRQVPGTSEFLCTLISHFGDLNGPLALVDPARGRFNPKAITSLTPEVPWPGMWPLEECFRDPVPLARDYFLCAHAPRDRFALYLVDRFGNREVLYLDQAIDSMCPTPFGVQPVPPVLASTMDPAAKDGEFFVQDVYAGIEHRVARGAVKFIRVCEEVRAELEQLPDDSYRQDHPEFEDWYATPTHKVSGPHGWPSFVAKASLGIARVHDDGSARFTAPAGKVLYFELLDEDFTELQRMRSVVQLQPGEKRGCVGCHERRSAVPSPRLPLALGRPPQPLAAPPWGAVPFSYEAVVQPVWNQHCVQCHDASDPRKLDFTAQLDRDKVPASYRTLIEQGWVHYLDYGWNSGGNEKREPLSFGTVKSPLWKVLDAGHYEVRLSREERHRIKCWTDLNCPLWPDYTYRGHRPSRAG